VLGNRGVRQRVEGLDVGPQHGAGRLTDGADARLVLGDPAADVFTAGSPLLERRRPLLELRRFEHAPEKLGRVLGVELADDGRHHCAAVAQRAPRFLGLPEEPCELLHVTSQRDPRCRTCRGRLEPTVVS
jgi:hypothetical protein